MTTFDDPDERARQVFTPIVRATLVVGALGLGVITPFIAINKLGAAIRSPCRGIRARRRSQRSLRTSRLLA